MRKTLVKHGDVGSTTISEQTDSYFQTAKPFRVDTLSPNGVLQKRVFYNWSTVATTQVGSTTGAFVLLVKQVTQDFDPTGTTHRDHAVEYTYSATTGDLTQSIDRGEVTASSD